MLVIPATAPLYRLCRITLSLHGRRRHSSPRHGHVRAQMPGSWSP